MSKEMLVMNGKMPDERARKILYHTSSINGRVEIEEMIPKISTAIRDAESRASARWQEAVATVIRELRDESNITASSRVAIRRASLQSFGDSTVEKQSGEYSEAAALARAAIRLEAMMAEMEGR